MSESLYRTPLYREQLGLGAKMVPFAGWEMPVQFEGIIKEHEANRKGCSIFDCSHMGEFFIDGAPEGSGLDGIVTQTIKDMPVKSCRYGLAHLEDIVREQAPLRGVTEALARQYFTQNIAYELTPKDYEGMNLYLKLALSLDQTLVGGLRS